MDLSTLSRQLNMSIHELRDQMKQAGFRLSPRARKVDNNLAKEIIRTLSGAKAIVEPSISKGPAQIEISNFVSVKDFSQKLEQPVTEVIKKLIQNGVMATINEEIDADTAVIIGSEFGTEVKVVQASSSETKAGLGYVQEVLAKEEAGQMILRAPIVAVMGHVDHGKTTLLDTIRKTNVVAGEAGAITQHVGAYRVVHNGKKITFLDTPGHEAFAAMRARGANVTDIIVLVVATDDSVKPQTVEVINRAKLAKTPLIVALNKIDKPDANPDRVKADLSNLGVTVEDWGGKVPAVHISAKKGEGIDKLLEIILLTAEVEELKSNPQGQVVGTVIDSRVSKGAGSVATVLVQNGTLHIGDPVIVGTTYGKIRSMEDESGKKLKQAGPSDPVQISGLSEVPEVGDILRVMGGLDEARQLASNLEKLERAKKLQRRMAIKADPNQKELKLILKADVQGSLEALLDALSKLDNEDVKLRIVSQGVGAISESDVQLAQNSQSLLIGFNLRTSAAITNLAKQKQVTIYTYDVIYELVESLTAALLQMMPMEVIRTVLGRVKIKAIFRTEKGSMIIGGEALDGRIVDKRKFEIIRNKVKVGEGKIEELQQNRVEVSEVSAPREMGLKISSSTVIAEGDILDVYDESVKRKGTT